MLCPAPLITSETANVLRVKGYETKIQKKNVEIAELKRQLTAALLVAQDDELRRRGLLREQMAKCDAMLDKAKDPKTFKQWVEAKARLWELLYPKPGSLRPKGSRSERAPIAPIQPIAEPAPTPLVATPALETTDKPLPVVPSETSENH